MHHHYQSEIEEALIWLFRVPAWLWAQCFLILHYLGQDHDSSYLSLDTKQGLLFTFIYWAISELRGYSWSMYTNFVIKERAEFNKLTLE